jgi:hypothetical protein
VLKNGATAEIERLRNENAALDKARQLAEERERAVTERLAFTVDESRKEMDSMRGKLVELESQKAVFVSERQALRAQLE